MKVRFNVDSGANIHSNNRTQWFDTVEDLGYAEGEWEALSDDEKYEAADQHWNENGLPEIFYEEEE